ncbi:Ldh family oxidoreductase [Azohydromonas australica]|uniref:Ldh family oxidoreductase n=1 Tax=Azohydromonas australica TaxID=364039 RepID=UPI0004904D57|nr:Ldh family oxidoreductase [Azohydromonas australica]
MDSHRDVRMDAGELLAFAAAMFKAAGLGDADAGVMADSLVGADLRGTHSHGLIRLPFLVARLRDGGANRQARIKVVREAPGTALLDGDRALGAITATRAMEMAVAKARTQGIGFVAATNSDFIGACAHYAMQALPHDMIGVAWTNGFPGMAPWGGRRNTIGNNPIAFAAPSGSHGPVVLDMALSVAAGGRIRLAAKRKEHIPKGWVLGPDGEPTDDPADLAAGGALLPLGYKGYGLAVFGEILCGVLTGSNILGEVPAWFTDTDRAIGNGHMHMAIDIARFIEVAQFKRRVDLLFEMLKATPRVPGVEDILLPGERAWRTHQAQLVEGIPVPRAVADDLLTLADRLGVPAPMALS